MADIDSYYLLMLLYVTFVLLAVDEEAQREVRTDSY